MHVASYGHQTSRLADTTAAQARRGKDIQGISWDRLNLTREKYRENRLKNYKNYVNLDVSHEEIEKVGRIYLLFWLCLTQPSNLK